MNVPEQSMNHKERMRKGATESPTTQDVVRGPPSAKRGDWEMLPQANHETR